MSRKPRSGCQVKGWWDKSHKKFCRIMQEPNVQRMHNLDYSVQGTRIKFKENICNDTESEASMS
ncbi:hypothetical protein PG997_014068 [Apiospora hydei]|uniref:Uncharacterized protein n=1 Tax=Apiospora hydei TaxID=1337664 RepID=A0ABR1V803_9PEZI